MNPRHFEVRLCRACGLRFPLEHKYPPHTRCPHCFGETEIISQKTIGAEQMTRKKFKTDSSPIYAAVLDNIRSAWNVGSIFRSADGFGFAHIYLCGITPTPENKAVKKTSLGAENTIQWSYHKNALEVITKLKDENWTVFALEEDERAVALNAERKEQKTNQHIQKSALILGNEITGVDSDILSLCDQIFYIPMQGEKRSLNVAIAFSVGAFALRQNR